MDPEVEPVTPPPACEGALAASNELELRRIALAMSPVIVEGRLGEATPIETEFRAPLEITRVHLGPSFMAGARVFVHLDAVERAAFTPGEYIVGFGGGNAFPTSDGVWWHVRTVIPSSERDRFSAQLAYRAGEATPLVAVVEIARRDRDRTRFRVIETLAGELPAEVADNWTESVFAASFPPASSARWIATFDSVSWDQFGGEYLAPVADIRPETPESRAEVLRVLGSGSAPVFDAAALREFASSYRTGWKFHRAPDVVTTRVAGLAGECCTNAGGTFVDHQITSDLRGSTERFEMLRGGHGYYSDEKCGDEYILGTADLELGGPMGCVAYSCEDPALGYSASLPTEFPTERVDVELRDTPENRARVTGWIGASEPNYLFYSIYEVPDLSRGQGANAPWSAPLSVDRALAAGRLSWIRVVSAGPSGDGYEVIIETTFSPYHSAHQDVTQEKLAFTCGDERLLQVGSEWLAPLVFEDYLVDDTHARFLVPGVLLPNMRSVAALVGAFDYALAP